MFSSTVAAADTFTPAKVYHPQSSISLCSPHPISISLSQRSMFSNFAGSIKYSRRFPHHRRGVFFTRNSSSPSSSQSETVSNSTPNDDFISRVLKENPSQVEPKYLVGNKLYTLRERENLEKRSDTGGGIIELMKWLNLNLNAILKKKGNEGQDGSSMKSDNVYLKDILREYKGKLYVPEQLFGSNLSEEAEFDSNIETLPRMMYEDFEKYLETGSIKMLTYKEDDGGGYGFRDFVVELKEIPGEKRLQKTKWVMTLPESEAQAVLEEYTGSRYEIEKQRTALVGKLPDYPHPVASSISSRMMVELGVLTAAMAAAAVFVGGFLASAVFAVTSFVFALAVFVIWPMTKPFLKLFISLFSGVVERISENFADIVIDGWISSKVNLFYNLGGGAATLEALAPIMVVVLTMVFLLRFTLSRRPKNYRKWDIWQGIEFSQSKAEARVDGSTGVTFKDVAGIEEAVEELQELVKYLKNPELFDKLGIKPPHGVLLEGPPGCGKTLVAKAIAGEAGVPFYEMAGSEFAEVLVGVGSARVRDLFKRAKVNRPSVIFVDEIDALAARRLGLYGKPTSPFDDKNDAIQERETTLNQLLIELDGFDTGKGVIFLGATNRKDLLDPALLRPGRFDRKIRIQPPNAKGRIEILNVHARGVRLSDTVDLSSYGRNLRGWTGAKLAQLLREAALVAVRKNHESILPSDMNEAVDRLTIGPKSLGIKLGYQGQCRRATTEVGIAITSHLLRRYENAKVESCDRISITPRGQTFSQIVFHRLDDESYKFERRPQLLHRLQVFLGGRAAEEVIYGRDTSRASVKYLADASWMARKIITIWNLEGMTIHGEPPPWRRRAKFIGPRLDFEGSLYRHYRLIARPVNFNLDDEVARRADELVCELYEKTVALLRRHHAALLKSVKVLLKQKEIRGEEIEFILQNYPPHTPTSFILGERDPGSLPFFEEQGRDMEYNLLATSSSAQTL